VTNEAATTFSQLRASFHRQPSMTDDSRSRGSRFELFYDI